VVVEVGINAESTYEGMVFIYFPLPIKDIKIGFCSEAMLL
jgi:hypothetical protein